ncbi:hypothetical protein HF673_12415 [Acidithiobacillus thiooxidans]|uniref:hypothetical protein n=1 Tax=Acidithiobacillus thiooxidans TaxID=930 RepID=UPI001C070AFB|nr:hypothetical protein [Acidithiobacillus thiooxidans]MBU2836552.1 hypothetical protein [Acidithiobacillus thiooxidans]
MATQNAALAEALVIKSPCDGCAHYFKCAEQKLACSDFGFFVRTGRIIEQDRIPSEKRFRLVFHK